MDFAFVQSVWTVVALIVFVAVVIWAYGSRRKTEFDKASRIACDDDRPDKRADNRADNSRGEE